MDNYQNENSYNNDNYLTPEAQAYNQYNNNYMSQQPSDKVSVGFCILGWFVPLFALIYFLTKKEEKPKGAKAVGICGLVSIILVIVTFAFTGTVLKTTFDNIDFSDNSYVEDTQENSNWDDYAFSYDNNTNTSDNAEIKLGGEKQGYIIGLEGNWIDFHDVDSDNENMVQYSNTDEIITMSYYDATGYSKEGIRNSVTASLDNMIANKTDIINSPKRQMYLYPDFYGESIYTKDNTGYQLFTMLFQSDKTSDMIYLAIESPFMSDENFENFVNQVLDCHSFITHHLEADY